MTSQIFMTAEEAGQAEERGKRFGWRYAGRYHMPLLPGEEGVKSGGNWVPYGIQSVTNLMDGFEDSRGLNVWEQEQFAYGLVKQPSLYEELAILVHRAERDGVDFSRLRDFPDVRLAITGGWDRNAVEASIMGRAKQAAGANEGRQAGTNRHEAWEHRLKTGELIGTPEIQAQILAAEELLERHRLQRIPDLSERVVRNTVVNTAGRFDDVLLDQNTGRLLMADLKTKKTPFRSWAAVDGQLATYARSEWMLENVATPDAYYVPGPVHHVDQKLGVAMVMPSDGAPPYLRRVDLEFGWQCAQHARKTLELRAYGKSAERRDSGVW
jgi:hypothetical protein